MTYIVYLTVNLINNKIYIGVHKTQNPKQFDGYLGCGVVVTSPSSYMKPNTVFQKAVKKYGTSKFRRYTLKEFDSAEEAYEYEATLVDYNFILRDDTYNTKLGGSGGCSAYIQINQFDNKGKKLKTWPSIKDAADFLHISDSAISNAEKFKGSCAGFYWSRESSINVKEYSYNTGSKCYQYNSNGAYIETYNSLPEAAKLNHTSLQSIQRAVKGGYKVGDFYYSTTLLDFYKGKNKISIRKATLYVYTLQGEFVTELKGRDEITKFFNIKSTSSITTALKTERNYRNYQLSLEKKDSLPAKEDLKNKRKEIECYNKAGELIKVFPSITSAIAEFGTGVQRVLKGQQQYCKDHVFKKKVNDIV